MLSSMAPNREEQLDREYRAGEAARVAEDLDDAAARHVCDYCPPQQTHVVTVVIGLTPGGDKCRACPLHAHEVPFAAPVVVAVVLVALRRVVDTTGRETEAA